MTDAPLSPGKAGRNEARRLQAGWFNTVSAALFLAGLLQPVLGVVQQQRSFQLAELAASLIFFVLSGGSFVVAQRVVRRLED